MCWSGEASALLALSGMGITAYLIRKGESKELWLTLLYFSLMELLQAVTYLYIDQCSMSMNKILTWLGYVHIGCQLFFFNMISMYFVPKVVKAKIAPYVYGLCCVGLILFMSKAFSFFGTSLCAVGREPFCGIVACSYKGDWHLAWQLPLNNLLSFPDLWVGRGLHSIVYILFGCILPILYGSWRLILIIAIFGPIVARLLTIDPNEFPAVWCLLSVGLCCSVIVSPIRNNLFVRNWPLYYLLFPGQKFAGSAKKTSVVKDKI